MIDLQSFKESLKIKWMKGHLDDNNKGKWKSFVNHYPEKHGGKLVFSADLKRQDTPLLNILDPFLAGTVQYWSTLNYSEDNLNFPSSQITGGPNSLHERGLLLASGVVLQTVIYKVLYGM